MSTATPDDHLPPQLWVAQNVNPEIRNCLRWAHAEPCRGSWMPNCSKMSRLQDARLDSALEEASAARLHRLHRLGRERPCMRPAIPPPAQPGLGPASKHCVVRVVIHLNVAAVFTNASCGSPRAQCTGAQSLGSASLPTCLSMLECVLSHKMLSGRW